MRNTLCLLIIWALIGCAEDSDKDETPADVGAADARVGLIDAAGGGDDGGGGGGAGGEDPDLGAGGADDDGGAGGAVGDAGVDAAEPDASGPVEVQTCQQACDLYAGCERLGELFGDEDNCLATCDRVTRGDMIRPEAWFDCIGVEQCRLIHLCRVPEPEPLSCAEVCSSATECGVDLPDCEAACDEAGVAFQTCGESVFGICDVDEFVGCLGRDVFTTCNRACEVGVACNVIRPDDCLLTCVQNLADPDPLFSLRTSQRNSCIFRSGEDCEAVNTCVNPPGPGDRPNVDPAAFCRRYSACGFDNVFPCEQLLARGPSPAQVVQCALAFFPPNACAPDARAIINACLNGQGVDPNIEFCNRLCQAESVCGRIEDDPVARSACATECVQNLTGAPDVAERAGAELECVEADRCPALLACFELANPVTVCPEHCGRLEACDLDFEGCAVDCREVFPRDRHQAHRACVAGAADCEGVAACEVAPGLPCEAICQARAECDLADVNCVDACDDGQFSDPLSAALEAACVLSAPTCEGLVSCFDDPGPGARACLGYCRAITECADAPEAALLECLTQCASGFPDVNGLRFAGASACLDDVAPDAACPALVECLPDAVAIDCDAHCAAVEACTPGAGCAPACADGDVTLDVAGCVADAPRAAGGCAAIAACVGYERPREDPVCDRACDLREACDADVDAFLCRADCTPLPEALRLQTACAEAARCGAELAACFDLPLELNPQCADVCAGIEGCDGLFPNAEACVETCSGQLAGDRAPDDWIDRLSACLATANEGDVCDAEAAESCFNLGIALDPNRAFGHHGNCETFNACNDAMTCANAACAHFGFGPALSWAEGLCFTLIQQNPNLVCDLFQQIPDRLDEGWGRAGGGGGCNIPVAYDVVCLP